MRMHALRMQALQAAGAQHLREHLEARLLPLMPVGPQRPAFSDYDLSPELRPDGPKALTPAAVLAPIILRPDGWTMLFTLRAADMPNHPGQVSLPGGRLQAEDAHEMAAALRETFEEIGLEGAWIRPIGASDPYQTVTGFHVQPIIALIEPGFTLRLDSREVAAVFEVPLGVVLDGARYRAEEQFWRGHNRRYYVLDYPDHRIWGATAGMLKAFCDRFWGGEIHAAAL